MLDLESWILVLDLRSWLIFESDLGSWPSRWILDLGVGSWYFSWVFCSYRYEICWHSFGGVSKFFYTRSAWQDRASPMSPRGWCLLRPVPSSHQVLNTWWWFTHEYWAVRYCRVSAYILRSALELLQQLVAGCETRILHTPRSPFKRWILLPIVRFHFYPQFFFVIGRISYVPIEVFLSRFISYEVYLYRYFRFWWPSHVLHVSEVALRGYVWHLGTVQV